MCRTRIYVYFILSLRKIFLLFLYHIIFSSKLWVCHTWCKNSSFSIGILALFCTIFNHWWYNLWLLESILLWEAWNLIIFYQFFWSIFGPFFKRAYSKMMWKRGLRVFFQLIGVWCFEFAIFILVILSKRFVKCSFLYFRQFILIAIFYLVIIYRMYFVILNILIIMRLKLGII